ncbi:YitT family protein [Paenibacillus sp. ACRRX]|uniref:YitT family protein n=1 Tax=unclassified Paenibacillus TaxID=185978 RepID=UPI001EF741EB|nr:MULTISPECIES: YitT family protein [unclassified Paenibacillus]MCG7406040.1 YitT family protein [Paenibacillus sp. ACRRX]MDK8182494.1 YitT family protein [Paenibacillus sp. UMB4589-SE434]
MKRLLECFVIIIGGALIASAFNLFLVPHHFLSGGVSGVSMITSYFTKWNISILYFAFNVPLIIWGWFILGRRFVTYSMLSVVSTTLFISIIPVVSISKEPLLAAVFGGTFVGIGSGLSLRVGGSSGGFDIIGAIVTKFHDFPISTVSVSLNAMVILTHGMLTQSWELALYSMVSIFTTGKVMDTIYINHYKVTVYIITGNKDLLLEKMLSLPHGITVIKTRGAFSEIERDMLMTVTTRYELQDLKRVIKEADPKAFVNIVETVGIMGNFRRPKHT